MELYDLIKLINVKIVFICKNELVYKYKIFNYSQNILFTKQSNNT